MASKKHRLTEEEVEIIRPDLLETKSFWAIKDIVEGDISLYDTNDFIYLLNTPYSSNKMFNPREWCPNKAKELDEICEEQKFDLSTLEDKKYFKSDEAQEAIFPLYLEMHEKHGYSFKELLSLQF